MPSTTVIQTQKTEGYSFNDWLETQPEEFKNFAKDAIHQETLREEVQASLGNLSFDYLGNKVWISEEVRQEFQKGIPMALSEIFDKWTSETGGFIEQTAAEGNELISLSSFAQQKLDQTGYKKFLEELSQVCILLKEAEERGTVKIKTGYVVFNDPELKAHIIENFKIFVYVETIYKEYRASMPSIVEECDVDIYGK